MTPRERAVLAVDSAFGYTLEFAPGCDQHFQAKLYDMVEEAIIDARRQAIEECAPRWQPIDTAPKSTHEGEYVRGIYLLGYCPEEGIRPDACICVIWWEPLQNGGEWVNEAGALVRPTHWMPLPEPPAAEEPAP